MLHSLIIHGQIFEACRLVVIFFENAKVQPSRDNTTGVIVESFFLDVPFKIVTSEPLSEVGGETLVDEGCCWLCQLLSCVECASGWYRAWRG